MILKLRNKEIIIDKNNIPERVDGIILTYDFELGTNHYNVRLTINGEVVHYGNNLKFSYDSDKDYVDLQVDLLDIHNTITRTYTGHFNYYKMSLIGDDKLIDLYKEIERLTLENQKLKEKGEVI